MLACHTSGRAQLGIAHHVRRCAFLLESQTLSEVHRRILGAATLDQVFQTANTQFDATAQPVNLECVKM